MLNTSNNIFYNKNIAAFVKSITQATIEAVENYWEQKITLKVLAINNFEDFRKEKFVSRVDFFSSKIIVEKHKPIVMRLSKEFIGNFFDVTLDTPSTTFKLSELTKLEIKIINNFCEFLYKKLKELLVPTQNLKITAESERYINFLFLAKLANDECFKFALSFPLDRVNFPALQGAVSFSDEDFLTSVATVKIRVGKTKVSLDELENLSLDDIVLLEESNASKLTLVSGDFEKEFNVKADPSMMLDLAQGEEEISIDNEVTMEKNLWDDIQIEVNAEFEKVKMTIGEIKQITQGQVVDLGSVFNNEISLFVENKKVAKGELIIINDRYAVKLTDILTNKPQAQQSPPQPQAQAQKPQQPQQAPPRQAPPPQQGQQPPRQAPPKQAPPPPPRPAKPQGQEDENFDYSDFEK